MFIRLFVSLKVGGSKEQVLATIETESVFKVHKLSSLVQVDNLINLPENLMITLLGMHYATTRGALAEKGAGTLVEKIIMPAISISKLTPESQMPKSE